MDPQLYVNGNSFQRSTVNSILDEWLPKLAIKENSNLLDIGCGDGNVFYNILLERLPFKYQKAIGIDISPKMVDFCNTNPGRKPNTEIIEMDIGSSTIPKQFNSYFDYIFSFNTLHWAPNREKALSNIYEMLNDGGEVLLIFQVSNPEYDTWEMLQKQQPWSFYLKDMKNFFSPYRAYEDPEKDVKKLLEQLQFINCHVELKNYKFFFENRKIYKNFLRPITLFLNKIPMEMQEDFLDCTVDNVVKLTNNKDLNKNCDLISKDYVVDYCNILCIYAQK